MKRNNLTTAVVAGIAGVAGIASVSNAVNLNSDGVGQVLVFPYYTVNNGLNTLISVVNTADHVKAVKVRFLEGKNSRECLDFNLYLSPYDVWTSALVATTSTSAGVYGVSDYVGQESVKILTSDTSCTAPAINGYEFLPFGFDPSADGLGDYDLGGRDMKRCTEGHFEVIDMGIVTDTANNQGAATAATHVGGVPVSCPTIVDNWNPVDGYWRTVDATDGILDPDVAGGLFGSASIIDVENGVDVAYNADAIQSYTTSQQHSDPGSLLPNLASGSDQVSNIFNNGAVQTNTWNSSSIQAVSALYMHDHIYGEYVLTDSIGANTEMTVTFPTKFAYVDPTPGINQFGVAPYEPFTEAFLGTACEEYGLAYWDREEQVPLADVIPVIPSPLPPGVESLVPLFCYETNVLELHDGEFDASVPSAILGSDNTTHFAMQFTSAPTFFDTGWVDISFNIQSTADNFEGTTYYGLPVTGFAVQRYVNSTDPSGAKNYAGLFRHRYSKNIVSAP